MSDAEVHKAALKALGALAELQAVAAAYLWPQEIAELEKARRVCSDLKDRRRS